MSEKKLRKLGEYACLLREMGDEERAVQLERRYGFQVEEANPSDGDLRVYIPPDEEGLSY